jgi:hypothetical protein
MQFSAGLNNVGIPLTLNLSLQGIENLPIFPLPRRERIKVRVKL